MKRIFVLCAGLLLALCVGVLSSCGDGNSGTTEEPIPTNVEGTWVLQGVANAAASQFVFDANNHFQYQISVVVNPQTMATQKLYFSGTYILKDRTVSLTFTQSSSGKWQDYGLATTATIKSSTELVYNGASFFRK